MTLSSTVRIGLTILVACRLGAAEAWAQLPAPGVPPGQVTAIREQVPVWLRSADAREVAWGAFFATQYRMANAVPLLVDALQRANVNDNSGEEVARTAALLDALIQLDARLDPALVQRFLPLWSVQTLILVDRATSDRDETLVSALESVSSEAWHATAGLLFESRPAGLVPHVLRPVKFNLEIGVQDTPDGFLRSGSGGGSGEGCMVSGMVRGFPPLAEYEFVPARPGAVMLVNRPRAVFYERRVLVDRVPCGSYAKSFSGPSLQERLWYAEALVRPPNPLATRMMVDASGTVVWAGAEHFRQRAAELRREVVSRYEVLLLQLVNAKLPTAAEAKALPVVVDVSVVDRRKDRRIPIPKID